MAGRCAFSLRLRTSCQNLPGRAAALPPCRSMIMQLGRKIPLRLSLIHILEGKIDNVNNYCIAVKEKGDDIIFLRKIVKGGADKSYGIQVARLAGVPESVTSRAKEIVEELVHADITTRIKDIAVHGQEPPRLKTRHYDEVDLAQMSLFDTVKDDDVIEEIKSLDVSNLTPIDALNTLYQLQNKLKNRW